MPQLLSKEVLEADRDYLIRQRDNAPASPWGTARLMWEQRLAEVQRQLDQLEQPAGKAASVALIFDGLPVIGQQDIRLDFSADILSSYQKIVSAWLATLGDEEVKSKGKTKYASKSKLYIRDLVRGSMGFILEELSPNQSDMFDSRLSDAVERSTDFLQALNTASEEGFDEQIDRTNPRLVSAIQRFAKVLKDSGASARIVGNHNEAALSLVDISRLSDRLADVLVREEPVILEAILLGVLPQSHNFELRILEDGDERIIEGLVTDDLATKYLIDDAFKDQLLLKPVRAFLRYIRTFRNDRMLKEQVVMDNLEPAADPSQHAALEAR